MVIARICSFFVSLTIVGICSERLGSHQEVCSQKASEQTHVVDEKWAELMEKDRRVHGWQSKFPTLHDSENWRKEMQAACDTNRRERQEMVQTITGMVNGARAGLGKDDPEPAWMSELGEGIKKAQTLDNGQQVWVGDDADVETVVSTLMAHSAVMSTTVTSSDGTQIRPFNARLFWESPPPMLEGLEGFKQQKAPWMEELHLMESIKDKKSEEFKDFKKRHSHIWTFDTSIDKVLQKTPQEQREEEKWLANNPDYDPDYFFADPFDWPRLEDLKEHELREVLENLKKLEEDSEVRPIVTDPDNPTMFQLMHDAEVQKKQLPRPNGKREEEHALYDKVREIFDQIHELHDQRNEEYRGRWPPERLYRLWEKKALEGDSRTQKAALSFLRWKEAAAVLTHDYVRKGRDNYDWQSREFISEVQAACFEDMNLRGKQLFPHFQHSMKFAQDLASMEEKQQGFYGRQEDRKKVQHLFERLETWQSDNKDWVMTHVVQKALKAEEDFDQAQAAYISWANTEVRADAEFAPDPPSLSLEKKEEAGLLLSACYMMYKFEHAERFFGLAGKRAIQGKCIDGTKGFDFYKMKPGTLLDLS